MPGPSSSRRQSTRAARSTAARPDNYYANNPNGDNTPTTDAPPPRSFPAIEHFTDSLSAVPHEMAYHFTMIKEVEAKLYAPEQRLAQIADEMDHMAPSSNSFQHTNGQTGATPENEMRRLSLNRDLNHTILGMSATMEEKISVLSNANKELNKWRERMLSAYREIPSEISSIAIHGNPNHWAYVTDKETKKAGNERTRREAAGSARSNHLHDPAAARSEARREAMNARRNRNQHQQDSDFEERVIPKKQKGKGTKLAEAHAGDDTAQTPHVQGSATGAQPKRKKAAAAIGGERAMAGAMSGQKRPGSPNVGVEDKRKRKTVPGHAPAKKRVQATEGKGARPTASPVIGSFSTKEGTPRGSHARARHGSQTNAAQALAEGSKVKQTPVPIPIAAMMPLEALTARAVVPDGPVSAKALPTEAGPSAKARSETPATMKREETEVVEPKNKAVESAKAVAPITTTAPTAQRTGRTSKTSTPVAGTFAETSRNASRATRKKEAGSHPSSESGRGDRPQRDKRGSRKLVNGDDADVEGEEDDDEEEDEPKYCYCNGVSSGEMVACDNPSCTKQWFHLECLGLDNAPTSDKWYCNDCTPRRGGRRD